MPTFNALFEVVTVNYNKLHHLQLDTQALYLPYSLESNVAQLSLLLIQQKGKVINIVPSNEVINWQTDGSLTVSMDYARALSSLIVDLGDKESVNLRFKLEITSDGKKWQTLEVKPIGGSSQLKAIITDNVLKMKLTNISSTEQKVYFKRFRWTEK